MWCYARGFQARRNGYWFYSFFMFVTVTHSIEPGEQTDEAYCLDQPYEAACPPDKMIVIRNALYGRMQLNQCIDRNFGYIGCHANVTRALAGQCSGRSSCTVLNLETVFGQHAGGNCPLDLKAFLQASYTCENVTQGDRFSCTEDRRITLTDQTGYLASEISQRHGYGTQNCPWFIEAKPGQYVEIKLHNFAVPRVSEDDSDDDSQADYCRQYAKISEPEEGGHKNVVACSQDEPVEQVYVSKGHEVEVALIVDDSPYFALQFKVHGCPLPSLPPASHITKKTANRITIKCNHSRDSWELECNTDSSWSGTIGNCSAAPFVKTTNGNEEMSYGVAIAIIVGVALFICAIIFLTGIIYLKRKDFVGRRNRMRLYSTGYAVVDGREMMQMKRSPSGRFTTHSLPPTPGKKRHGSEPSTMLRTQSLGRGRNNNGEYAHIWEIRRPIPVSTPKVPGNVRSAPDGTSPRSKTKTLERSATAPQQVRLPLGKEDFPPPPATFNTFKPLGDHVYESPRFAQFHRGASASRPGSATPASPMYFQVDTTGTVPRGRDKPIPPRRSLDQGDKSRLRTMGMSGSVRREADLVESEEGKITV